MRGRAARDQYSRLSASAGRSAAACVLSLTVALALCSVAYTAVPATVPCISVPQARAPVTKVVDPRTGACRLTSSNPALGSYRALDSALAVIRARDTRAWGTLRGSLRQRLQSMRAGERVPVRIQLKTPAVKYPNRFTHSTAELRAFSLAIRDMRPVASLDEFLRSYSLQARVACPSGYIEATATGAELERMRSDARVAVVEELGPLRPCGVAEEYVVMPWTHLAAAALNPAAHPADQAGAGVRAATVEWDTTWDYYACRLGLGATPRDAAHADQTMGCLMNAAPAASVHQFSTDHYGSVAQSLADSAIETVSMSVGNAATSDPDAAECITVDDLAYRWPFTVFCNPAGNGFEHSASLWACYNAICVGSEKHWQEAGYQADVFTSTRNPAPVYDSCPGPELCAGDRELPELLAPGSHPYQPQGDRSFNYLWYDSCFRGYFYGDGTSFAAPTANGVAARVISSAPQLVRGRPEAVKMALLLTAANVDAGEWDPAVDGRDGAGGISAYGAVEYLSRCTNLTGQSAPAAVVHGFYTDTGYDSMPEREFTVLAPPVLPDSSHLRVALVWTSNPDMVANRNSLSDLDIGAFNSDAGSHGSYSLDASVEIFNVPRAELTPGATYTFRLFPRVIRIPTGARTDFFYYALGWTWVRDHAPEVGVRGARLVAAAGQSVTMLRVLGRSAGRLDFECALARGAPMAQVSVLDLRGALVCRAQTTALQAGLNRMRLALPTAMAAGTYCLEVAAAGQYARQQFTTAR